MKGEDGAVIIDESCRNTVKKEEGLLFESTIDQGAQCSNFQQEPFSHYYTRAGRKIVKPKIYDV